MEPSGFEDWLRWVNPGVKSRLGHIRHVLFDFDGTISTLRQGWEKVMEPLMVTEICGSSDVSAEISAEVHEYIDHSTGILTIRQMEWLAQTVTRRGLNGPSKTPMEYKAIYLDRLMVQVKERLAQLEDGTASPHDYSMAGSLAFTAGLNARGVKLYLASGTDHHFILNEASALGLLPYFSGGIYGALDESDAHAKDRIIYEILERNHLNDGAQANELLVVGDGSVEMREAAAQGAIALGVASDEVKRRGWNEHKVPRLIQAGADILVSDFRQAEDLMVLLTNSL